MPLIPGTKCWLNKDDVKFIKENLHRSGPYNSVSYDTALKVIKRSRKSLSLIPVIKNFVDEHIRAYYRGEWS